MAFFAPFSALTAGFAFEPLHPQLYTALTSLFLHDPANILHLLGNLVFLAAVGPLVESEVGPFRFLVVYLVSGLVGVAAHWVVSVSTGVGAPLIGASSAIAGLVGYGCVRFALRTVPLAPNLRLNVGAVALVWVVLQAVGAFISFGGEAGTSYMAHIGGFVGGLGLAFVLRAQHVAGVEADRARMAHRSDRSPAAALDAADEFLKRHPDDLEALWCKAAALHKMGDRDEEAQVLARIVRIDANPAHAIDCLVIIDKLRVFTASERMRFAAAVDEDLRRDILMNVVNEPEPEPERPYALLALAEMSGIEDRATLVRELKTRYPMHAATDLARAKGLLE